MGKEVENLIMENNELLATKYGFELINIEYFLKTKFNFELNIFIF